MGNLWLVARYEFRRMVLRRGYLIGAVAVPLAMVLLIALVVIVENLESDDRPVGYVDPSGLLDPALQETGEDALRILPFSDLDAAIAAIEQEAVQAVFVFPPDYPANLQLALYYLEDPPDGGVWRDFDRFVRLNLLVGQPDAVRERVLDGPNVVITDVAGGREFSEETIINILVPFAVTFFFFISTMTTSGYMLQIVADEKENRTMELMLTSLTPGQLIWGKALGLLAAALGQLLLYVITGLVGIYAAAPSVPELQQFVMPWQFLGLVALFFLPSYALIAAFMVAIGGSVTNLQQGQQIAGILNIMFLAPMLLLFLLFQNPGHPVFVFMTLFPTTALLSVSLRWGMSTVPSWQLISSWIILLTTAGAAMWMAARVFRAGMLRYGQPLTLRSVMSVLRGG